MEWTALGQIDWPCCIDQLLYRKLYCHFSTSRPVQSRNHLDGEPAYLWIHSFISSVCLQFLVFLIKADRLMMMEWATSVTNVSFLEDRVSRTLKETLIRPICKNLTWWWIILATIDPSPTLLFFKQESGGRPYSGSSGGDRWP